MGWTLSGYGMGVSALRTKSVIRDSFSFEQQDNVQDFLKSKKNEQNQLAKKKMFGNSLCHNKLLDVNLRNTIMYNK